MALCVLTLFSWLGRHQIAIHPPPARNMVVFRFMLCFWFPIAGEMRKLRHAPTTRMKHGHLWKVPDDSDSCSRLMDEEIEP